MRFAIRGGPASDRGVARQSGWVFRAVLLASILHGLLVASPVSGDPGSRALDGLTPGPRAEIVRSRVRLRDMLIADPGEGAPVRGRFVRLGDDDRILVLEVFDPSRDRFTRTEMDLAGLGLSGAFLGLVAGAIIAPERSSETILW